MYLGILAEGAFVNDFVILIVTMLRNFVLEFLFCKFVVYCGQEDTLKNKYWITAEFSAVILLLPWKQVDEKYYTVTKEKQIE